jgi:hypothetical protein
MNKKHSALVLPLVFALVLLAVFVLFTPVFAQDEVLPPEAAPTEVITEAVPVPEVAPTEAPPEIVPTEIPVVETPVPEGAPTGETPVEVPTEASQPPAEEPAIADLAPVLDAIADAGLTLVDGSGEPLTLANEKADQTLTAPDPWFKVGTIYYHFLLTPELLDPGCDDLYPSDPFCFESLTPIQDAINYISVHGTIPSDGFIHVEEGEYPDQRVEIDGTNTNLAKLKGIVGHVDPDTLTPDAYISYTDGDWGSYIYVHNKLNGFTLSGIMIYGASGNTDYRQGVVEFDNCSGALLLQDLVVYDDSSRGNGITIHNHNGSVTLTNVDSSNNVNGGGAFIDNTAGTAGVTVTNSSFDGNDGSGSYASNGIHISTFGAVNITAVTASRNTGNWDGLLVHNASSVTIKNSVINDNTDGFGLMVYNLTGSGAISLQNLYIDHNKFGLQLSTPGNITLTNVSANQNTGVAARLDTCWELSGACSFLGTGKVTITGGTFNDNLGFPGDMYTLQINARGAIALTNVSANKNGTISDMGGAYIDTHFSQLVSPVTITNSTFNTNDAGILRNLMVLAKGAITLTSVQASFNPTGPGALLDNHYGTTAGVTLKGSTSAWNKFNNNANGSGLVVRTNGAISLSYVESYINQGLGVDLDNYTGTGSVTFLQGFMTADYGDGLKINTRGAVTLTSIDSELSTTGRGVFVDNHDAPTAKPVIFTYGDTSYNHESGVFIRAKGAVTITGVSAIGNTPNGYGIQIENNLTDRFNVTLKDIHSKGNPQDGVKIDTNGIVLLTNVDGILNGHNGIFIHSSITPQPVTINGMEVSQNSYSGLDLWANGVVSLSNITAESNQQFGIKIGDTPGGFTPKSVTINHAEINSNGTIPGNYDNLNILSGSFVTLSNINASHCGMGSCNGVRLGSAFIPIPGVITINHSVFSDNRSNGVYIYSKGNIVLSDVTANSNDGNGAALNNNPGAPLYPTSSISNSEFNENNGYFGLQLYSLGGVTLTNVQAESNLNGYGAYIRNESGNVSLLTTGTNYNVFGDNGSGGLEVDTAGSVILNNVGALGNTGVYGAYVHNSTGNVSNVTVSGGEYSHNSYGLYVEDSIGSITVTGMTATYNTFVGALLINTNDHTGLKGVTISKSVFEKNARGLKVQSWGQITLNGVSASSSTSGVGADLDNTFNILVAPKGISVLGTLGANNFNSNHLDGLSIISKGAVIVTKVTSNDNLGRGIYIDNHQGGLGKGTVALSYLTVYRSGSSGIEISSNNAVTLSNSTVMFTKNTFIGIYIQTHNHNLTVSNSLITSNSSIGLAALLGGPTGIFKMTGTYYFGNCTGFAGTNILVTH